MITKAQDNIFTRNIFYLESSLSKLSKIPANFINIYKIKPDTNAEIDIEHKMVPNVFNLYL